MKINERWKRNIPQIKSIQRSIDQYKEKIKKYENDEMLDDEIRKAKILDALEMIKDLEREIINLKKPFELIVQEAKYDLEKLYLDDSDDRPWAVAWSGGKDSTTVMGLVVSMLESLPEDQRQRKIYAVMSDTRMENPNLEEHMHEQVELLNEYAVRKKLPIQGKLVSRPLDESYFYLILGKGYFLPQNNGTGRWCTSRLKIRPQNRALKEINPSYILIGTRLSESAKRKASIKKWRDDESLNLKIGRHESLTNTNTFMPIVDFTIEDVWEYLQKERLGWSSTHKIRKLYRDATGECGFTNPKETERKASLLESCGARFGCWTCPVILKDRSTEEMAKRGNEWMYPLSEWRFLQLKVMGDYKPEKPKGQKRTQRSKVLRLWENIGREIKFITKSGYNMDGKRMVDKNGNNRDDWGTLTIEARQYLFDKLMETKQKVNELRIKQGLEPLEIISQEEIDMIKARWEEDKKHRPWLKTNVRGIPFSRVEKLLKYAEEQTEIINNEKVE